ncbi:MULTISPECIES: esterase/lipase family protein [unclassified Streptomyces]|uniref:esterase/lipase family protein n=1 Tax=unclassified Streptomyces TaxID=2593676 RepID=UPI002DDA8597|nr:MULTISPECIES: hypothetical protein [unclassified Streptomyces]WSF81774.1 hypothetical protein OIE70_00280 [Streptomyces sp. NBC_01744]WSC34141.1 hypothetical protein OHA08_00270 [Streptomyces sp. NBC_01763]WSC41917.1 hypothetical protein OHA08_44710 [Streptomyces sp. NBC_01763]WSC50939.1 hypothetical protein OG808_00270 [Streptomyces sp. NBC_01761]WSC58582.1 hypothetical protein OG808_44045 [Streptomyces sp. NBC_01761]
MAIALLPACLIAALATPLGSGAPGAAQAVKEPIAAACGVQKAAKTALAEGVTPVLFVHGFNSGPAMWTGGVLKTSGKQKESNLKLEPPIVQSTKKTLAEMVSESGRTAALTFDYSRSSTRWVTDITIGYRLADTISCLRKETGRKVIVIAHSMGGLATQWAASREGGNVAPDIASVITLATPFKGSWFARCSTAEPEKSSAECGVMKSIISTCHGQRAASGRYDPPRKEWDFVHYSAFCKMLPTPDLADTPAGRALGNRDSNIDKLPGWPSSMSSRKIYRMASQLIRLPDGWPNVGDLAVTVSSATAGSDTPLVFKNGFYHHMNMHRNPQLAKAVVKIVKDSLPASQPPAHKSDWNNRSYDLTCDDTVTKPVNVTLRNGGGVAKSDVDKRHDHWEIRVQQVAEGSLPNLGKVTAVLFSCSPQPSNFYLQELRVYRSSNGREVGRTPSFDVSGLSPKYQPKSLAINDGRIRADVKFYGANDSHASGPSILRHITWSWNGKGFTEGNAEKPQPPKGLDVNRDHLTVNGIGPLKLGMTHRDAEKAIGAPIIAEYRGPACTDDRVEGGPQGLFLRFAADRLVAIAVRPPATTISTASGIHIDSTRSDVLTTYSSEVTTSPGVRGDEELVFAPRAPRFEGKVIVFGLQNGDVSIFIAGEREWATLASPCGGD